MDNWRKWKKPLKLHEIIEEIQNLSDDTEIPDGIAVFPPDGWNTDEDSGDENTVILDNLPGSQLMADAEVIFDRQSPDGGECEGDKNRDDIPSTSVKRLKMAEDADSLCNPTGVFEDNHYDSEDELPLATYLPANQQHALPNKMRKKPLYTWKKEDIKPDFSDWKEYYGPKNSLSPLEIFSLFIDDEVVNLITDYSNLYASQHNHAGDISANEVRTFIGVLLLSGYNQFPRRAMYWENSDDAGNKLVYSAISRDRFTYIMQNIHTNDNTSLDQNDKFSKMRPLFDLINKKFQLFAPFEECHSVDESMVPYYGGHGSKQFIRGKPIRWGYKLWQGTTRQGYIEWFEPYQGSKTPLPEKYRPLGLGASVVLQFADVLQSNDIQPNAPFHVFCDNFFTSLPLLSELTARGLKCTGTLRENRISSCPLRNSKLIKKEIRGTFEYSLEKSTNVIVCKWNDNNVVTIASNVTSPLPTQPVKRFCQSKKKNVNIDQPHMIKKYNESMGGVDRADQNISLYRIAIRGKKWYFCLLAHCLDMAEQNAWQLHKRNGGNMDHLTFRRCIAAALLETFKKTTKRGPSKKSKNNHLESRYDRLDHLVIYQEKQTRCAVCHKQAAFRCEKCDVALHPKICFLSYHTKE